MKKVHLIKTTMLMGEPTPTEVELDYRTQIQSLLLIPLDPQAGTNYEEMAIVLPIHGKFNTVSEFVLLEDAEHAEVVKRLKGAKFRQNTPEIFEMIRSVVDAPEHLVEALAHDEEEDKAG